jgi:hypothetical protein
LILMLPAKTFFQNDTKDLTNDGVERQVSELSTNASTRGLSASSTAPSQTLVAPTIGEPQAATGAGTDGESSDKT